MRDAILAWFATIGAHPAAVLTVVFAAACAESIAVIGTLVPAGLVMFAAGVLISTGALDGWTALFVAAAGAVLGDGFSYEIGRRYYREVGVWWSKRKGADNYARGEAFVHRHGMKSIVLARFFAPVRAIVPVVVGCARLPRRTFYPVNVLSALAWAPAHLAPGILFGASAALADAMSARLAAIFVIVVALGWGVWLGVRFCVRSGIPVVARASSAAARALGHRSPRLRGMLERIAARCGDDTATLGVLAIVFVCSVWLFGGVLQDVIANDPLMQADTALYTFLASLRTAPVDVLMSGIAALSGRSVGIAVAAALLVWLAIHRNWRSALYWAAVAAIALAMAPQWGAATGAGAPAAWQPGSSHAPALSGDAAFGALAFGFAGWMLMRRASTLWRRAAAAAFALWIVLAGFARLYLGEVWLSGLLGSWSLALAWFALLAGAYVYLRIDDDVRPGGALLALVAALAVTGVWTVPQRIAADRTGGQGVLARAPMSVGEWKSGGWLRVPTRRIEISGDREEYFPLQWRATEDAVARQLAAAGWQRAPAWSVRTVLRWLVPQTSAGDLPVLPELSRGASSELAFVRTDPRRPALRLVLRLWRDRHVVHDAQGPRPLWYGALYRETLYRPAYLITVEQGDAVTSVAQIERTLSVNGTIVHAAPRTADVPPDVLLVSTPDDSPYNAP